MACSPRSLVLLWLGARASLCVAEPFAGAPLFPAPQVDYGKLVAGDPTEAAQLLHALTSLGTVAVRGIPGFSAARRDALGQFEEQCLGTATAESGGPRAPATATLADGSIRRTVAASTVGGLPGLLADAPAAHSTSASEGKEAEVNEALVPTVSACDEATAGLRAQVATGGLAVFRALDLASGRALPSHRNNDGSQTQPLLPPLMADAKGLNSYRTFEALTSHGEQLEHFHLYEPPTVRTKGSSRHDGPSEDHRAPSPFALEMHTDAGLLIAMTTGLEGSSRRSGPTSSSDPASAKLYVELPHGAIAQLTAPDDALLFLCGQGAQHWLNSPSATSRKISGGSSSGAPLRAVPHALVLPWNAETPGTAGRNDEAVAVEGQRKKKEGAWRAWHGRMYLPPPDALVPSAAVGSSSPPLAFADLRARQRQQQQQQKGVLDGDPSASTASSGMSLGCGLGTQNENFHQRTFSSSSSSSAATESSSSSSRSLFRSAVLGMVPLERSLSSASSEDASSSDDDDACGEGKVQCWMQCYDATGFECAAGSEVQCVETSTGAVVPGDITCTPTPDSCQLACAAVAADDDDGMQMDNDGGFCSGMPLDMYMTGFASVTTEGAGCIALFFSEWALDTATKFTLACIGLFLAAFTSEWVGYRRRLVFRADSSRQQNRRFWMVLLYAVQVTSGYFLMLAAMTYQVELFLSVVVGLTLGHAVYSLDELPTTSTDPCCAGQRDRALSVDPTAGVAKGYSRTAAYLPLGEDLCQVDRRYQHAPPLGHAEEQQSLSGGFPSALPTATSIASANKRVPSTSAVAIASAPPDASERTASSTGALPVEVTLAIQGMTCNACVSTVSSALHKVPGVVAAEVALHPRGLAWVTASAAAAGGEGGFSGKKGGCAALVGSLVAVVNACGFDAQPEGVKDAPAGAQLL